MFSPNSDFAWSCRALTVTVLMLTHHGLAAAQSSGVADAETLLTIDHFVPVRSTAPGMSGQTAQLYLRERVKAGTALRGSDLSGHVVLFVHGAGTPAEVAFDTPFEDYSWMAYLAGAGFDAFSVDMTGYGRSSRPSAMNERCNLSSEQQRVVSGVPAVSECAAGDGSPITTIASDWNDIGAVVDYIRELRGVERVSMVAWSLGGPRAGGFAARNPEKVDRLVLLAPAYNRGGPLAQPASLAGGGAVMNVQSRSDFDTNWNRQAPCADQYDPRVADVVWQEMLRSDPVGATWGPGVRRAPRTPVWGWNAEVVGRMQTPALLISPAHDGQVAPARVMELYQDLGSPEKVLVDLGCTSHNAHWERNHLLMFQVSLEWLTAGTAGGQRQGIQRLGY